MALPTASDNVFPKLIESMNTSNPAAPSDSSWKIFAKADGIYARSSNTTVGPFAASVELDYVEYTSPVNITATVEASANTIVTGSALTYDGSTIVMIEYFAPYLTGIVSSAQSTQIELFDGSSAVSGLALYTYPSSASTQRVPAVHAFRRLTPSAGSHTYSIRGYNGGAGTAVAGAGPGTASGNVVPGYIRITKVR